MSIISFYTHILVLSKGHTFINSVFHHLYIVNLMAIFGWLKMIFLYWFVSQIAWDTDLEAEKVGYKVIEISIEGYSHKAPGH